MVHLLCCLNYMDMTITVASSSDMIAVTSAGKESYGSTEDCNAIITYTVVIYMHTEESVSWAPHKHSTGVITQISHNKQLRKERKECIIIVIGGWC